MTIYGATVDRGDQTNYEVYEEKLQHERDMYEQSVTTEKPVNEIEPVQSLPTPSPQLTFHARTYTW